MKQSIIRWFTVASILNFAPMLSSAHGEEVTKAIAIMLPAEGQQARGVITFTKVNEGVRIQGRLTGLSSGGHGIHIHQFGDCSSTDLKSAGGHFNPLSKSHGDPSTADRHVGDLGNLLSESHDSTMIDHVDKSIALTGNNSIIGRAVIIHEGADDLKSQPSGNSGKPIACGVIGIASN